MATHDFPDLPDDFEMEELGLADRSEELELDADKDVRIRFYNAMASSDIDKKDFVDRLCRAIATLFCDMCAVFLIDDSGNLRLVAAHDVNEALNEELERIDLSSILPRHLRLVQVGPDHRADVTTADSGHDFTSHNDGGKRVHIRAHSALVVPLHTTLGEPFGAMFIARHATSCRFTETDVAKVRWVAADIATRIEAGRLHAFLRSKNEELKTQAARLSDAVRDRDEFISAAAHDLKTPLSTMGLQLSVIRRKLDSRARECSCVVPDLDIVSRQVRRLSTLIDRLLDTSMLTAGEPLRVRYERMEFVELAAEVVDRFIPHAAHAGVRLRLTGSPVEGDFDRDRLDQVLSNLLSNAIKYSHNGEVVVEICTVDEDVLVRVTDDGIGVPAQARHKIFERFQRGPNVGQRTGLGLGLWITKQIVERMGGTICLREKAGSGSSFEFQLPRASQYQ